MLSADCSRGWSVWGFQFLLLPLNTDLVLVSYRCCWWAGTACEQRPSTDQCWSVRSPWWWHHTAPESLYQFRKEKNLWFSFVFSQLSSWSLTFIVFLELLTINSILLWSPAWRPGTTPPVDNLSLCSYFCCPSPAPPRHCHILELEPSDHSLSLERGTKSENHYLFNETRNERSMHIKVNDSVRLTCKKYMLNEYMNTSFSTDPPGPAPM